LVGTVPALVSQEDFDRVQAKLALNKRQAAQNNKSHRYLLRALVSCGACQVTMIPCHAVWDATGVNPIDLNRIDGVDF